MADLARSPSQTSLKHGMISKLLTSRPRSGSAASIDTTYASSGRVTPEQRRRSGKAAAQSLLANDAKYKKFATQVDRALQSFESVNEWADFISFLSRLLKTLQAPSPPYTEIPRKLTIAKRLAQCLNPALPSGVHQRALDVYSYIFGVIGDGLRRDLLIWSSGLFPFFQFATTSVRPLLLNLYEQYYLPIGDGLRPAGKAMILALLPGLEEETGDHFERVFALFNNLSERMGEDFFVQNTYLVLISSPPSRLATLNYLARRAAPTNVSFVQAGLMVRGVAAALGDDNMLVRRNALDLLLRILPLDGATLDTASDTDLLVRAVSHVVLQRDVSLSRRVYAWFLGPEAEVAYFTKHGLDLLARVLLEDMRDGSKEAYRVFLSLLDKGEIASVLVGKVVMPALKALRLEAEVSTAAAIYEAVEPAFVWGELAKAEHEALIHWLVKSVPHDEDVCTIYAPAALLRVLQGPNLVLAEDLLSLVTPSCWLKGDETIPTTSQTYGDLVQRILVMPTDWPSFITAARMARVILDAEVMPPVDAADWARSLLPLLEHKPTFAAVDAIVSAILHIATQGVILADAHLATLLGALFNYLSANRAMYHARAVELLWETNQLADVHTLENVVSARLAKGDDRAMQAFGTLWRLTDDAMLPGEIFFVPAFMVLDALKTPRQRQAETWLRCNLRSYFRLIDPILARLLDPARRRDVSMQAHLVESLAALLRFGGQALGKALSSELAKSVHPALVSRKGTYLELLVTVMSDALDIRNLAVQYASIEVLQLLVGHVKDKNALQSAITAKTTLAVERADLALQPKLLHLLHSPLDHRALDDIATLIELGVSAPSNQPILQHWIDFVLLTSTHFQPRRDLLQSLAGCLDNRLRRLAMQLKEVYHAQHERDVDFATTELEPIMLLDALERVVMLLLAQPRTEEKGEGSSILGMMSNVFTVEGPVIAWLDNATHALLVVWAVTSDHDTKQTFTRVRRRTSKVLEKVFSAQSTAVLGSCIRIWALASDEITDEAIFNAVDVLTPSAQRVVEMTGEALIGKGRGDTFADPMYTAFLEAYLQRLEAPIAVQVWTTMFNLARDMYAGAGTPPARVALYPMLRCLTVLARIVASTSALEDRRLRRDLQETYAKVLDGVVGSLAKVNEVDVWERTETDKKGQVKINAFIAHDLVPYLRALLVDNDRVAAACSSISIGILVPAFRHHRVDASILDILTQMSHLSAAHRSWRPHISDAFSDSRFFHTSAPRWRPLVHALMDSDKERFPDLLSRIAAAPSANIFVNREQEMISRSLNLRRLSYVLLAAEQNHYLVHLPSIQEKLVDVLRTDVVSPRVHSEVYLALRVLMCRVGAQHLTNFWPVILAELISVFEGAMDDPPADGAEELALILAACKFLDLLLVIQSDDFQIHQWMFVVDTTDAVFPPETHEAESIMDRLTEVLAEFATPNLRATPRLGNTGASAKASGVVPSDDAFVFQLDDARSPTGLRRPRLSGVRALGSLRTLLPFFARASIETYEGVYAGAGVDWEAVEEGLWGEVEE